MFPLFINVMDPPYNIVPMRNAAEVVLMADTVTPELIVTVAISGVVRIHPAAVALVVST
jgi:hypothetical protein